MVRESGAALAVLALYILILLAPLHQAAASQRDFAELGYSVLDSWSVCAPLAQDRPDGKSVVKCAAAGIGKNQLAPIDLPAFAASIMPMAGAVQYARPALRLPRYTAQHPGNPRSPPTTV